MTLAIAKAKETGADVIFASDPDADRIGCVARDASGEYVLINGNQIVMILLNYIMQRNRELGLLKGNEYVVKTIVTTETIRRIADRQGIKLYDSYTGFKWIANVIREHEKMDDTSAAAKKATGLWPRHSVATRTPYPLYPLWPKSPHGPKTAA